MCLAQEHNTMTLVRLESAAPPSQVKHSTTEPQFGEAGTQYPASRTAVHSTSLFCRFYQTLTDIIVTFIINRGTHQSNVIELLQ